MIGQKALRGHEELRTIRQRSRGLFWAVGVFSLFANLLMLTGPMYMLQVYDRVLGSGSVETLVALSLLVAFLFAAMAVFDAVRARIMTRIGLRFQRDLDDRVFDAVARKCAVSPDTEARAGFAHLDAVQRLLAAPVVIAGFDLPWTVIFFGAIFVFHPYLGVLAVAGAALLVTITIANQLLSKRAQAAAGRFAQQADSIAEQVMSEAETVEAMGMRGGALAHWKQRRNVAQSEQMQAIDVGGGFSAITRTLRLFLQSAMLGTGAWLVLNNQMTPGGMMAGSILLGRALSPIETLVHQWPVVQQGVQGWHHLAGLLAAVPVEEARLSLPEPAARLTVNALTVVPPGDRKAVLKAVGFQVAPGQAVGVIGPSGTGKSSLARALTGVWRPAGGDIRLDGATLDQYGAVRLGCHIGYLPQRIQLFDGTVAQNIARLAPAPDEAKVVAAARRAAAHDMILDLPQGYDTVVRGGVLRLSGGQMQRIALARALYDDPVVLVLDEPNANLDNAGSQALNEAIKGVKARGGAVLIMAHRPSAIQECEMLLVLDKGVRVAFGPKDEVLSSMVKNVEAIQRPRKAAGIT
ncbi:type I secretion system permease/ATPase [Sulfitobacter sp. M57]|uniref:type I secretion system permease/ATPase n=1 Tax=unclassified Sulfitobacter TaxID=196795 RepID=UPI0023E1D34A|nr:MULTISPECIES: type I secretion system permease/ATPase [unclassified Sulfitobacter]MDF3414713.1 type I secretion system permease/ATPase [Sulfitobacter sp. KE5]MDF3422194.1 type I secretion system permease/ATPase [Sulfitobacter sp. KE43]MDF3433259.1 type I secretion system permease/ATPase [Sulfitobacter sp. KE42]MDF3458899.1 type I secretion system permease/ATPase [Sulfitobacter sp. S74]MDF3462798.1 type I secretion system permease/ATPase [Sulfitobacter sp. Ks18]